MIYKNTYIIPADNCGVFWVKIFHLYTGGFRTVSFTGDFAKGSVRDTRTNNKIKKRSKTACFIIRTAKSTPKHDNSFFIFFENNAILLKKRMTPKGTDVIGPILNIIKRKKFKNSFAKIL
jgi:ribosomal protein L14